MCVLGRGASAASGERGSRAGEYGRAGRIAIAALAACGQQRTRRWPHEPLRSMGPAVDAPVIVFYALREAREIFLGGRLSAIVRGGAGGSPVRSWRESARRAPG
jgi:hypothetical protein